MATTNGHSHPETNRTVVEQAPVTRTVSTPPPKKRSRFGLYAFLFAVILGGAAAFVFYRQAQAQSSLVEATKKMLIPSVLVIHPELGSSDIHLVLPGTVQAEMESAVYPQVSGYVKRWLVDIGSEVKAGQLLAEIDTPVTDQQLRQAKAAVDQAQASLDLAKTSANRYNDLLKSNSVSQQEVDNQNANVAVQAANVAAAQANVQGLQETEIFKEVKAPFDGVVTSRKVDVGDLVTSSGGGTASAGAAPSRTGTPSQELFRVAQTKILRVYVSIPEAYSSLILPGTTATLEMASAPKKKVVGKLVRTSHSIDPNSLTLLAEVDVPNPDNSLLPGGYAQVHFDVKIEHPSLVIPGNTLIFRSQGTQIGIVDPETSIVHLKDIKIGHDFGTKLEVIDGLKETDAVIMNPSDSLEEGAKVEIKTLTPGSPSK